MAGTKTFLLSPPTPKGLATRESSGKVLNVMAENLPWMVGGSADLAGSDKTRLKFEGAGDFQPGSYGGRNLHFGVREHGMAAAVNGMAVSKIRPFCGTFFNFSDYMRPSVRLAALMEIPTIYVFTHDSIGLGEDGPTHQPIEQLASLRAHARPHAAPAGGRQRSGRSVESHHAVGSSASRHRIEPASRCPHSIARNMAPPRESPKGHISSPMRADGKPEVILIGTGSEVSLCMSAYEQLTTEGIKARVVSMPSWGLFESQSEEYKAKVLPPDVKARVAVEQAATFGW